MGAQSDRANKSELNSSLFELMTQASVNEGMFKVPFKGISEAQMWFFNTGI